MDPLIISIFSIIILIFSVVIHEVAHGAAANALGDPTAKLAGRLTLNPLKHLDPVGSVLVPLFLILSNIGIVFGWAKPVPINPYNFRDQKYGEAKVSFAGPAANLLIAIIFGLILRLMAFVSLPLSDAFIGLISMLQMIVLINLVLAIFNLMPIPPLDGSHLLFAVLPRFADSLKLFFNQYGLIILFIFIFFGFKAIEPIISFFYDILVGF